MARWIDKAETQGFDSWPGGKWVVVCSTHSTVLNVATRAEARATSTDEFCEGCQA